MQNIRGVDKQIGAANIRLKYVFSSEFSEFLLGGLPREVGIRLRKAIFSQTIKPRGTSKGLSKEDAARVIGRNFGNQQGPEVLGLGVRMVPGESGHSALNPHLAHPLDLFVA